MGSVPGTGTKEICRKHWNMLLTFQPTPTPVYLYKSIYDQMTIGPSVQCYRFGKVIMNNSNLKTVTFPLTYC